MTCTSIFGFSLVLSPPACLLSLPLHSLRSALPFAGPLPFFFFYAAVDCSTPVYRTLSFSVARVSVKRQLISLQSLFLYIYCSVSHLYNTVKRATSAVVVRQLMERGRGSSGRQRREHERGVRVSVRMPTALAMKGKVG